MSEPKKLEDLSVLEINAEIGIRMELIEKTVFELNALRQRRVVQAKAEQPETKEEVS